MSLEKPKDFITFNKTDFTKDYFDKQNDLPLDVIILNLPLYGVLKYNNNIINKNNFIFNIENSELLSYIRLSNQEYTETINFKLSDNNLNKLYSEMATITINVNPYVNLPPDQVGDNELTSDYGELVIFTSEDFTTNTTPVYDDPEGDSPYKLKILTLPSAGNTLKFNNINVVINDEILFSDIKLGLLTMITNSNIAGGNYSFNFAVSDTGSQQFST